MQFFGRHTPGHRISSALNGSSLNSLPSSAPAPSTPVMKRRISSHSPFVTPKETIPTTPQSREATSPKIGTAYCPITLDGAEPESEKRKRLGSTPSRLPDHGNQEDESGKPLPKRARMAETLSASSVSVPDDGEKGLCIGHHQMGIQMPVYTRFAIGGKMETAKLFL